MLAHVSVKSHHNGNMNPKAHFHKELTIEQVMNAPPIISWPLGLFDCCGVSDGGAAAILVRAADAKKFRDDPVYIKSVQMCVGPAEGPVRNDYDFTHVEETLCRGGGEESAQRDQHGGGTRLLLYHRGHNYGGSPVQQAWEYEGRY